MIGPDMSNSSIQLAPFVSILHGIILPVSFHEFNHPELQIAGMKMIGMDFVAPKNIESKVRQIADLLELEPMDIHYTQNFANGQDKPTVFYYVNNGDHRDLLAN